MGASKTVYESVKLLVSFLFYDNPEKELKDCPFVFSFLDFTKKRLFFSFCCNLMAVTRVLMSMKGLKLLGTR